MGYKTNSFLPDFHKLEAECVQQIKGFLFYPSVLTLFFCFTAFSIKLNGQSNNYYLVQTYANKISVHTVPY